MYTFRDRADRSLTLRPEGTAPAIRAFVEKKLYHQPGLHKYYYLGPMFRYERPQAGRYRQHHQFGAEALGDSSPERDIELIDLLCEIYRRLDLKNLTVYINSVGDAPSRINYKKALFDYLKPLLPELSKDSQERFNKNILRILDSKDPADQKIISRAPTILDYLQSASKTHFEKVLKLLDDLKIPHTIQPTLVRGLDYYNETVFEITSGLLGAQNSIGAGGRYDGLTAAIGGPDLPAVGFATGLERLLQTMLKQHVPFPPPPHPFIFLIPLGEKGLKYCFQLLCDLRHEGIPTEIDLSGKKVQHALSLANAISAEFSIIVGDNELSSQRMSLKNMSTRETQEIASNEILTYIKTLFSK